MGKERLSFKINGRSVVYAGYLENRPKDLMEAMAKLDVEEGIVIQTFRDNIDENDRFQDDEIMAMFHSAKSARAARAARQNGGASASASAARAESTPAAAAPPPAPAAVTEGEAEAKCRITLHFQGKTFSYMGYPSAKKSAVIQLLVKQRAELTYETAISTFRTNLPDLQQMPDNEVWEQIRSAIEAKTGKPCEIEAPYEQAGAEEGYDQEVEAEEEERLRDAINKLNAIPREEHEQIRGFIRQVLEDSSPAAGVAAGAAVGGYHADPNYNPGYYQPPHGGQAAANHSSTSEPNSSRGAAQRQKPLATPAEDENDEHDELADSMPKSATGITTGSGATGQHKRQGTMSGRMAIYCQEAGDKSNPTKVIYSSMEVSFEEFTGMVAKKFGRAMALSFEEDDDIVEIDDDDVLALFFERVQESGKKVKLICSKAQIRVAARAAAAAAVDNLTNQADQKENPTGPVKAEAFSSGDLEVTLERTFLGHTQAVYSCAFSLAGDRFVSASRDRSVRVWNVNGGKAEAERVESSARNDKSKKDNKGDPQLMKGGHNGFVLSCDFSPLGSRVVSSSEDRGVKVWNTRTCSKTASLKGHSDKVYCVQYSPSGDYIVSASCDCTVRVWSAENFSKEATLKGHTLAVFSCCFSNADGGKRVLSGSDDRLIKIWNWEESKEIRTLRGHSGTIWSVAFSHNDRFIVSASMDHELRMWMTETGECIRKLAGHKSPTHHAIFSSNDKYIFSCARDCSIKVWRAEDGELVETIVGHSSTVYHMDIHGERLLTSSLDTTLKLWNVKNLLV